MTRETPSKFDPQSFAALLSVETERGASQLGLDVDAAQELARVIDRGRANTETDEETERRLQSIIRSLENVAMEENQ